MARNTSRFLRDVPEKKNWIRKNIFQPVIPWMVGEVSVAIVVMIILVVVQTVLQLE